MISHLAFRPGKVLKHSLLSFVEGVLMRTIMRGQHFYTSEYIKDEIVGIVNFNSAKIADNLYLKLTSQAVMFDSVEDKKMRWTGS